MFEDLQLAVKKCFGPITSFDVSTRNTKQQCEYCFLIGVEFSCAAIYEQVHKLWNHNRSKQNRFFQTRPPIMGATGVTKLIIPFSGRFAVMSLIDLLNNYADEHIKKPINQETRDRLTEKGLNREAMKNRKVVINGVVYPNVTKAAEAMKCSARSIRRYAESESPIHSNVKYL